MRRTLTAAAGVLIVGVLAWEFVPIQVTIWDGSFDLTVVVESQTGRPRSVSCKAFDRREGADDALAVLQPAEPGRWSTVADPSHGKPLTVEVAMSGRTSSFGRELRRWQHSYLLVIATWPDGRQVGKVVEIPDGRVSRQVSATLP